MIRQPLDEGTPLCLLSPDGTAYRAGRLLGEGGTSLVYEAIGAADAPQAVVKEFFPAQGAHRDESGRVCPDEGMQTSFYAALGRFENEMKHGAAARGASFQILPVLFCEQGYALMLRKSADASSLAELERGWRETPPLPESGAPDPCFADLARAGYALRVVDSLLNAVDAVHQSGRLHLDLSASNVLWAGAQRDTGRGCAAFLTDFGSAVETVGHVHRPSALLTYSPGYAAPEMRTLGAELTPATDLYSVGMLLFYLCCGEKSMYLLTHVPFAQNVIEKKLSSLKVPPRVSAALVGIVTRAAAPQKERFQSAQEMQRDIRAALALVPPRPVNPDPTREFTLYSLRSMLEGGAWARELSDRRGVLGDVNPNDPIADREFSDDWDFLFGVLPENTARFLREKTENAPYGAAEIMSGRLPADWKRELAAQMKSGMRLRRLAQVSDAVLDDETALFGAADTLFSILGEDGAYLHECFVRANARRTPSRALALLTLYALLGGEVFRRDMVKTPREAGKMFEGARGGF